MSSQMFAYWDCRWSPLVGMEVYVGESQVNFVSVCVCVCVS